MREGKDLFRREQLFAHLRICTFVWPLLPIKPPKKTNTQKTPSDGNRSTVAFCKFVFVQADRGFAAGAVFFLGGGKGAFWQKRCNAPRATDFREKRNPPQADNTYISTYLSTLSTKDFAKINKITMEMPFVGSYGMDGLFEGSVEGFY